MNIRNKRSRLGRFYGDVARKQNAAIISLIRGKHVLDIGCGYGTLMDQIRRDLPSKSVTGIDIDAESIDTAKAAYGIDVKKASAYGMDFPDSSFDTVILRETVHHFDSDEKLKTAFREICRVTRKELIIFDPNPNWIVKLSRIIIRHKDPEAPPGKVVKALESSGFRVDRILYRDILAFPLSGGFVGLELIPNISFVKKALLGIDRLLSKAACFIRMEKHICWRYLLRARKV